MQEIGRSGRDGLASEAILYFNKRDIASNVKYLREEMKSFCLLTTCRRAGLLSYFGNNFMNETVHPCCDNCMSKCECSLCVNV